MPAATTKDELQAVMRNEYSKLDQLLVGIEASVAEAVDDDGVSIKDTVAHRAHWIGLFIGWYTDGRAGNDVHFPAEGYKWNELKRYNADLRTAQRDVDWPAACSMLDAANRRLEAFIDELDDEALYGGPMAGASNEWTPGRWAEAAGPSHYRSAAKYIRARLRS